MSEEPPKLAAVPQPARPEIKPAESEQPSKELTAKERALQPAGPTRVKPRHWLLVLSFLIVVILPSSIASWYLWTQATDQYASTVGFSVRQEEGGSPLDIFSGGIPGLSGSSSSDADILYEFLQSQKLVGDMDNDIGLVEIWSRPKNDPIFAFKAEGNIEDLMNYWERMVKVYYDRSAGLIEVRALAFNPEEATLIAQTLFDKSSEMINSLSSIAREDGIRYSWEELEEAKERLSTARQDVQQFRNKYQLVDPTIDVAVQSQLIGNLQGQRAEARIALEIISEAAPKTDPRVIQAQHRLRVIEEQITKERHAFSIDSTGNESGDFGTIIGEYERLIVEREFAERTYIATLAAYDIALAEARRKSRYLAAYTQPTTAQSSRFPQRGVILSLLALFLFLSWSISALVAYSLKDRR